MQEFPKAGLGGGDRGGLGLVAERGGSHTLMLLTAEELLAPAYQRLEQKAFHSPWLLLLGPSCFGGKLAQEAWTMILLLLRTFPRMRRTGLVDSLGTLATMAFCFSG